MVTALIRKENIKLLGAKNSFFRLFHGPPIVPHYANNKTKGIMQVGHTFTIEPMLCEGTPTDIHWPDDWTSVTKDGKRSAQFEHTLLVTESGCDILTERAK